MLTLFEGLLTIFTSGPSRPPCAISNQLLDMPHNSAVVMWGGCQERYKHSVPALPKGVGIHPISGEEVLLETAAQIRAGFLSLRLDACDIVRPLMATFSS